MSEHGATWTMRRRRSLPNLSSVEGLGLARCPGSTPASPADLARVDIEGIQMVCLLYLNENSIAHARYLIRRLRRRMPEISILVAFLSLPADPSAQGAARTATKAELYLDFACRHSRSNLCGLAPV